MCLQDIVQVKSIALVLYAMVSKWDPLIGKLFGAFPIIAVLSLVALEASISADKIRSVQKGWPALGSDTYVESTLIKELKVSNKKIVEPTYKATLGSALASTSTLYAQNKEAAAAYQVDICSVGAKEQGVHVWATSVLSNGTTIEGEHINGIPHGIARAVTASGLVQQGEHANGVLHGRGSIIGSGWGFADTETTGFWANGVRHGPGRKLAPYIHSEGACVDGKQNGEWKYVFKNGRVYTVNHDKSSLLDDIKLFWASFG